MQRNMYLNRTRVILAEKRITNRWLTKKSWSSRYINVWLDY